MVGTTCGGVDYAAVSDVLRRYERALSSGRTLRREKVNINRRFLNRETCPLSPDGTHVLGKRDGRRDTGRGHRGAHGAVPLGYPRFHGKEKSVLETLMDGDTPEVLENKDIEDLFDDIEGNL